MKEAEVIELIAKVMGHITAGREEEAKAIFNPLYPGLRPQLTAGAAYPNVDAVFLFEVDEYLNNPEARRAGASSLGLLMSSYNDLGK